MAICYNLWHLGIVLWSFGIFFRFGLFGPRKIWQPWTYNHSENVTHDFWEQFWTLLVCLDQKKSGNPGLTTIPIMSHMTFESSFELYWSCFMYFMYVSAERTELTFEWVMWVFLQRWNEWVVNKILKWMLTRQKSKVNEKSFNKYFDAWLLLSSPFERKSQEE
jgi:hypothetical protein